MIEVRVARWAAPDPCEAQRIAKQKRPNHHVLNWRVSEATCEYIFTMEPSEDAPLPPTDDEDEVMILKVQSATCKACGDVARYRSKVHGVLCYSCYVGRPFVDEDKVPFVDDDKVPDGVGLVHRSVCGAMYDFAKSFSSAPLRTHPEKMWFDNNGNRGPASCIEDVPEVNRAPEKLTTYWEGDLLCDDA